MKNLVVPSECLEYGAIMPGIRSPFPRYDNTKTPVKRLYSSPPLSLPLTPPSLRCLSIYSYLSHSFCYQSSLSPGNGSRKKTTEVEKIYEERDRMNRKEAAEEKRSNWLKVWALESASLNLTRAMCSFPHDLTAKPGTPRVLEANSIRITIDTAPAKPHHPPKPLPVSPFFTRCFSFLASPPLYSVRLRLSRSINYHSSPTFRCNRFPLINRSMYAYIHFCSLGLVVSFLPVKPIRKFYPKITG